jgi:hypothetical protein
MPLSYAPRWHCDILRALDYFCRAGAEHDLRLQESINLLISHRPSDGRWPVRHKHPARVCFDMEKTGGASRWSTLRALRILKWWSRGSDEFRSLLERSE